MECPNCGFELRDTDKFCNECGTKIQNETEANTVDEVVSEVNPCEAEVNNTSQNNGKKIICKECGNSIDESRVFCPYCHTLVDEIKSFEDKLKEVPPMSEIGKCPNCGKETNLNDTYCSHCMAALRTDDNNESNKIPFYKNYSFWASAIVIAAFIFVLITLVLVACEGANNNTNDNVNETSYEQFDSTTTQESYICYVINEVSFYVNSDWLYKKTDSGYLFNNYADDKLMVDAKVLSKIVDDSDIDNYIKNIEKENNYKLISNKLVTVYDNRTADNLKYNYTDNNDDSHYVNMFVFTNANTIYSVRFDSLGDSQSSNSIDVQDYLLKTLTISESDFAEETTEKETEPPTEKPTERTIQNNTSTDGFWANGSGDYVATGLHVTGYGILNITNYGDSNFIVVVYEGDKRVGSIVNEIGNYSGTVLIDHSGTFDLEVKSNGSWDITSSGLEIILVLY